MGHVVNPISFRITKSLFWKNIWTSLNKSSFTNLFLEDLSYNKFIVWLLNVLGLKQENLLLLNFNLIRIANKLFLNIKLSKMYNVEVSKKAYHLLKKSKKHFKKHSTILLTYFAQFYKYKKISFVFKKKVNYMKSRKKFLWKRFWKHSHYHITFWMWKKLNFYFKMFIYKQYSMKGSFVQRFEYYSYINVYKHLFLIITRSFFFKPKLEHVYYEYFSKFFTKAGLTNYKVYKKRQHLNQHFFSRIRFYLNYFLNLLFFDEKKKLNLYYKVNFFIEKNFYNSASLIANLIEIKVKQGFFIGSAIKKMLKYLFFNSKVVLGYKMYFSGRYAKKLRNFAETYQVGRLSLSTSNFPLDYFQMAILTKIGIIGLKVWVVKKNIPYEAI